MTLFACNPIPSANMNIFKNYTVEKNFNALYP